MRKPRIYEHEWSEIFNTMQERRNKVIEEYGRKPSWTTTKRWFKELTNRTLKEIVEGLR